MKKAVALGIVLAVAGLAVAGCRDDDDGTSLYVSSRAYKGHEADVDMNNLVNVYPSLVGTRLDDCQTCHKGGEVSETSKTYTVNPCSYCHLVANPDPDIISGAPSTYHDTLNPYGADYMSHGRDRDALEAIHSLDSDGDGYENGWEIHYVRYPGDPDSMPGQPSAPTYTMTWTEIASLPFHSQFLLMNAHKQAFDDYARYGGVKVKDLLSAAGVNLTGATSITVIAPDGFAKDYTISEIDNAFPYGLYDDGLAPGDFADPNQGFVNYPPADQIPSGLADMGTIPDEPWLLIAYRRDGADMDVSYLDPVSGKISGEGPYRLIIPQSTPGSPDRGSKYSPTTYADGYDYDENKDHNAGKCVKGVAAIRINPMPSGYEEFDWKNGGFSILEDKELIIYGHGVTGN